MAAIFNSMGCPNTPSKCLGYSAAMNEILSKQQAIQGVKQFRSMVSQFERYKKIMATLHTINTPAQIEGMEDVEPQRTGYPAISRANILLTVVILL